MLLKLNPVYVAWVADKGELSRVDKLEKTNVACSRVFAFACPWWLVATTARTKGSQMVRFWSIHGMARRRPAPFAWTLDLQPDIK